jgi:hypothetical protein
MQRTSSNIHPMPDQSTAFRAAPGAFATTLTLAAMSGGLGLLGAAADVDPARQRGAGARASPPAC